MRLSFTGIGLWGPLQFYEQQDIVKVPKHLFDT